MLRSLLVFLSVSLFLFSPLIAQNSDSDTSKTGWIKIETNLPEFFIVVNGDYLNHHYLNSGDSILVSSGKHAFTVVGKDIDHFQFTADIPNDSTLSKEILFMSLPRIPRNSFGVLTDGKNLSITTDEQSEIFIDGKSFGRQYTELLVSPGKHHIVLEHPHQWNC